MKILHVNALDINGGAARATYRLHKGLLANGIESEMVVGRKSSEDLTVYSFDKGSFIERIESAVRCRFGKIFVFGYRGKKNILWSANLLPNKKLVDYINNSDCDVVNLHWINEEFLSISDIKKIKKPIVWTMHDMWIFTGGCHVVGECKKYKAICDACARLKENGNTFLSKYVFYKKLDLFTTQNISFVSPSNWLADCAQESTLLRYKNINIIPNGIDTSVYKPLNKKYARMVFNIADSEHVILFGAVNSTSDYNKGYDLLKNAIRKLPNLLPCEKITLVIFGSGTPKISDNLPYKTIYFSRLYDDASLVCLYNCADVMVVPSRMESFGQTALEAMACGVPVVAFASTGLLDIVEHKQCGYLAEPYDVSSLSEGIAYCIRKKDEFLEKCIHRVEYTFDISVVAKKYVDLYKNVLHIPNV